MSSSSISLFSAIFRHSDKTPQRSSSLYSKPLSSIALNNNSTCVRQQAKLCASIFPDISMKTSSSRQQLLARGVSVSSAKNLFLRKVTNGEKNHINSGKECQKQFLPVCRVAHMLSVKVRKISYFFFCRMEGKASENGYRRSLNRESSKNQTKEQSNYQQLNSSDSLRILQQKKQRIQTGVFHLSESLSIIASKRDPCSQNLLHSLSQPFNKLKLLQKRLRAAQKVYKLIKNLTYKWNVDLRKEFMMKFMAYTRMSMKFEVFGFSVGNLLGRILQQSFMHIFEVKKIQAEGKKFQESNYSPSRSVKSQVQTQIKSQIEHKFDFQLEQSDLYPSSMENEGSQQFIVIPASAGKFKISSKIEHFNDISAEQQSLIKNYRLCSLSGYQIGENSKDRDTHFQKVEQTTPPLLAKTKTCGKDIQLTKNGNCTCSSFKLYSHSHKKNEGQEFIKQIVAKQESSEGRENVETRNKTGIVKIGKAWIGPRMGRRLKVGEKGWDQDGGDGRMECEEFRNGLIEKVGKVHRLYPQMIINEAAEDTVDSHICSLFAKDFFKDYNHNAHTASTANLSQIQFSIPLLSAPKKHHSLQLFTLRPSNGQQNSVSPQFTTENNSQNYNNGILNLNNAEQSNYNTFYSKFPSSPCSHAQKIISLPKLSPNAKSRGFYQKQTLLPQNRTQSYSFGCEKSSLDDFKQKLSPAYVQICNEDYMLEECPFENSKHYSQQQFRQVFHQPQPQYEGHQNSEFGSEVHHGVFGSPGKTGELERGQANGEQKEKKQEKNGIYKELKLKDKEIEALKKYIVSNLGRVQPEQGQRIQLHKKSSRQSKQVKVSNQIESHLAPEFHRQILQSKPKSKSNQNSNQKSRFEQIQLMMRDLQRIKERSSSSSSSLILQRQQNVLGNQNSHMKSRWCQSRQSTDYHTIPQQDKDDRKCAVGLRDCTNGENLGKQNRFVVNLNLKGRGLNNNFYNAGNGKGSSPINSYGPDHCPSARRKQSDVNSNNETKLNQSELYKDNIQSNYYHHKITKSDKKTTQPQKLSYLQKENIEVKLFLDRPQATNSGLSAEKKSGTKSSKFNINGNGRNGNRNFNQQDEQSQVFSTNQKEFYVKDKVQGRKVVITKDNNLKKEGHQSSISQSQYQGQSQSMNRNQQCYYAQNSYKERREKAEKGKGRNMHEILNLVKNRPTVQGEKGIKNKNYTSSGGLKLAFQRKNTHS